MALADGTVSVDDDGNVSGEGFAREIYDIEAAADPSLGGSLDAYVDGVCDENSTKSTHPPTWQDGGAGRVALRASTLARRVSMATRCSTLAAALNAQTKTATVAVAGVTAGAGSAVGTVT